MSSCSPTSRLSSRCTGSPCPRAGKRYGICWAAGRSPRTRCSARRRACCSACPATAKETRPSRTAAEDFYQQHLQDFAEEPVGNKATRFRRWSPP